MRITHIDVHVCHARMRNWVFVQVRTDQPGLEGWGEATLEWKTRAVVGAIEDLTPLLLGRDPRDVEQLVRVLTKHSFWRLGVIGMPTTILIDQGLDDPYLAEQLHPHLFEDACRKASQAIVLRRHQGYDHGYYFIQTFIADHVRHHARQMSAAG